jgi:EpsI family protein
VPIRRRGLWPLLLLAASLTALVAPSARWLMDRWFPAWTHEGYGLADRLLKGDSYYTHGPLVPLVSLLIAALLVRHTRIGLRPAPGPGFCVLAAGMLVFIAGHLVSLAFIQVFAVIGMLAGGVLIVWGRRALRRLWFPIAFLVFLVPLPMQVIADVNFRLKLLAADMGLHVATLGGVIVTRSGSELLLTGGKTLMVGNVCGGLRTIISLLAFGALYAYVCKLRGGWRIGLFALTIPVALASNCLRIVGLILVADVWDAQVATGAFHDASGLLIFVFAFLFMFGIERLILWLRRLVKRPAKIEPLFAAVRRRRRDWRQWRRMVNAGATVPCWAAGLLLLGMATWAWVLNGTGPAPWRGDMAAQAVPHTLQIDGRTWVGRDVPVKEAVWIILSTPDVLIREYRAAGVEEPVTLIITYSMGDRRSIHGPDVCMEGGGGEIVHKKDVVLKDVPGRGTIGLRELIVHYPKNAMHRYALYTFKCGDGYTTDIWQQQLTIAANRLLGRKVGGGLIQVVSPGKGREDPAAKARCQALWRAMVPHLDEKLP